MSNKPNTDLITYFRSSLSESYRAFVLWEALVLSRSTTMVGADLAEKYLEIQNEHLDFFQTLEKSAGMSFVVRLLQCFDRRKDASSFFKLDRHGTQQFLTENSDVLSRLKHIRDNFFAHKNLNINEITFPAFDQIDAFFVKVFEFYNTLSRTHEDSFTLFDNIKRDVLHGLESVYMNLYRGEIQRKSEIELSWLWEKNPKKISQTLDTLEAN